MNEWTEAEKRAWTKLAEVADAIMHLPVEHPMEQEEAAHMIHGLQNYLLARPTYRREILQTRIFKEVQP